MTKLIVGVDEVGVGAVAGPLVVAAVAFSVDTPQPVLHVHRGKRLRLWPVCDSKKVKHDMLPAFRMLIIKHSVACAIAYKTAREVDEMGTDGARDAATALAIHRTLERARLRCPSRCESYLVILDGAIKSPLLDAQGITYHAIPHADRDVWQVSAASILAKESQVLFMAKLDKQYPQYGFAKHHGYPTTIHIAALQKHGVTKQHRRSYRTIRAML